jgi:hypothetical protein
MTTSIEQTSPYQKSDISVIIPFYFDNPDRIANLNTLVKFLEFIGISDILISEYYNTVPMVSNINGRYLGTCIGDSPYNRCHCINKAFEHSNGKIIAIWDVDVIFQTSVIDKALQLFNSGSDIIYPYDGRFYNLPKSEFHQLTTGNIDLSKCELWSSNSVGGCVMFKRETFEQGGKYNPNFLEWGYEDNEIVARFTTLGYNINRTDGCLIHMEHDRNKYADGRGEYVNKNQLIYNHIKNMNKEQLLLEIDTWK